MITTVPILSRPEGPELRSCTAKQFAYSQFQSSPGPKARSYALSHYQCVFLFLFQSSPGPKARSYELAKRQREAFEAVPILSRPEGPELLYWPTQGLDGRRFQSSPGPKARSYLNPANSPVAGLVPILSRPEGPELHGRFRGQERAIDVPILSRPEGPELLFVTYGLISLSLFQSSPGPKARSYYIIAKSTGNSKLFQSSPGPKARSYACK